MPDPTTETKRGGKNFCLHFFVAKNLTKCKIILFLTCAEKKLSQFAKNYITCYLKGGQSAVKNMGLGPEIRDPVKTYSGSATLQ
jgi:hypothetical protein